MNKGQRLVGVMNQVYREFSRQKYNKYRHQHPKMRESEIVSKIIKEWDALTKEGRDKLESMYSKNKFISEAEASEADSEPKSLEVVKVEKAPHDRSAKTTITVKTEPKEEA
jgi:hypothetical protein